MGPYCHGHQGVAHRSESGGGSDEATLICMALALGAARVAQALVCGETWGAEATLGMFLALFALREFATARLSPE